MTKLVLSTISDKVSLLATDEHSGCRLIKSAMPREVIKQSKNEYVRGEVHTNSVESFWSLLKLACLAPITKVTKKHLPLYLAEFQYRFNSRGNENIFFDVIAGC